MVTGPHLTALVYGTGEPVEFVYHGEPVDETDSGFGLLLSDAPRELDEGTPVGIVHVECVLEEWPHVGRGLDLAREHGGAELTSSGEWKAER